MEWPDTLAPRHAVAAPAVRTRSRKRSWMRVSPASSGWKDVAIAGPARRAHGSPSCAASTSTPGPARSMRGARMKTPWNGCGRSPSSARSASNESQLAAVAVAPHHDVDARRAAAGGQAVDDLAGEQDHARRRCRAPAGRREQSTQRPARARRRRAACRSWWTRRRAAPARRAPRAPRACAPRPHRRRARRSSVDVLAERALQREDADLQDVLTSRALASRSSSFTSSLSSADADHGVAEPRGDLGERCSASREVRGGLDDRPRARRRVVALEDAGADEARRRRRAASSAPRRRASRCRRR